MAASVVENDDLLTEILIRLPVKPLMRFKCVSKQSLTLISNPRFCRSHAVRRYQTTPPRPFPSSLLLNGDGFDPCPDSDLSIIPLTSSHADPSPPLVSQCRFLSVSNMSFTVIQSCNGLLLVSGHLYHPQDESSYFVCNPVTKQFVGLSFPTLTSGMDLDSLFLAFDPLRSSHFKVVSIRRLGALPIEFEINVYSSETGCWSDLGVSFPASSSLDIPSGIYCNGAIHWYNADAGNSLYFDVENQCLKTFPMPSNIEDHYVEYFGESGGHLHMIMVKRGEPRDLVYNILEVKEDYSGWSVRFQVDLNRVLFALPHWNWDWDLRDVIQYVLCIVRQEKEEDSTFVYFINGRIMSYNLVNDTVTELISLQRYTQPKVFQYVENLSWVGASTAS